MLVQVYATNIRHNYFLENDMPVVFHILDMDLSIQASIDVDFCSNTKNYHSKFLTQQEVINRNCE